MLIFDGLTRVFSTCRACKELMRVVDIGDTVHLCCELQPTKVESLATGWLSAVSHDDSETASLTEAEIVKVDTKQPSLCAWAIRYAQLGWPVFPLRPVGTNCDGGTECGTLCRCPKKPATSNGLHDATTDMLQVKKWWKAKPNRNIGLATGYLFDVFDIDVPEGVISFTSLLQQRRVPDVHGVVITASGGMHLYLKPKGIGNKAGFMPGLDYRGLDKGRGGYVVAPPSRLDDTHIWSWSVPPSPEIKGAK